VRRGDRPAHTSRRLVQQVLRRIFTFKARHRSRSEEVPKSPRIDSTSAVNNERAVVAGVVPEVVLAVVLAVVFRQ